MPSFFLNIALTSINLNNCKSSSSQLSEQRACVLSTSCLCLGRAGMCQKQLGHVQGRCWQAQHEAALQVTQECSHLIHAPNHVTRGKPEKPTRSCLVTDWVQTGLFGHQFLAEKSHNLHFLLSLLGYPFISLLPLFLAFPALLLPIKSFF